NPGSEPGISNIGAQGVGANNVGTSAIGGGSSSNRGTVHGGGGSEARGGATHSGGGKKVGGEGKLATGAGYVGAMGGELGVAHGHASKILMNRATQAANTQMLGLTAQGNDLSIAGMGHSQRASGYQMHSQRVGQQAGFEAQEA